MESFGRDGAIPHEVVAGSAPFVLGPLLVGLVVTAMLIGAVWWGMRVRAREPGPPRPEEQPRLPDGGAVHEVQEMREPDEMPHDGRVLTPHELRSLGNMSTRRARDQKRPQWNRNSSGGFGSGGLGHH
ncbi:DUF6479 family protein [Streptomyces aurantiacus]|uniref:Secreted protein n=1 Tax=Streptomyces aurantiacus TaxID=47760 RepID=A0A7G1PFS7_9ACTN|nr:DUF6479 family protein [Streptomyces aurantiacus]BCL32606.1 hypothetical protein GCM10017557_74650 [Streptomyces aurantiacus]